MEYSRKANKQLGGALYYFMGDVRRPKEVGSRAKESRELWCVGAHAAHDRQRLRILRWGVLRAGFRRLVSRRGTIESARWNAYGDRARWELSIVSQIGCWKLETRVASRERDANRSRGAGALPRRLQLELAHELAHSPGSPGGDAPDAVTHATAQASVANGTPVDFTLSLLARVSCFEREFTRMRKPLCERRLSPFALCKCRFVCLRVLRMMCAGDSTARVAAAGAAHAAVAATPDRGPRRSRGQPRRQDRRNRARLRAPDHQARREVRRHARHSTHTGVRVVLTYFV